MKPTRSHPGHEPYRFDGTAPKPRPDAGGEGVRLLVLWPDLNNRGGEPLAVVYRPVDGLWKRDPRLGIGAPTEFAEGNPLAMFCRLYVDVPAVDPLHPTGRCTCAGEGRCGWCHAAIHRIDTD